MADLTEEERQRLEAAWQNGWCYRDNGRSVAENPYAKENQDG